MTNSRIVLMVGMILLAGFLRLVPHPPNFAPIAAMALFAGAHFQQRALAFLVPLMAMLLSDMIIGFHSGIVLVYVCMAIAVAVGMLLKGRMGTVTVAAGLLASAVIFFVVTNFGVWFTSGMYALSIEGLVACYVAAIPFFHNTVLGNVFFGALLFGGFALMQRRVPALRGLAQT